MSLSNRGGIILKILSVDGRGTIKKIAKKLGITERTVRYELDKIDIYLVETGYLPLEKIFGGQIEFKEFDKFKKNLVEKGIKKELDTKTRRNYIYFKILFDGKANLTKIMKELDISRTTVKTDIRYVKEKLKESDMFLKSYQQEGLILVAKENNLRHEQLKFLKKYSNMLFYEKTMIKNKIEELIEEYIKNIDIKIIELFINEIQNKINKLISDEAYNIIAIYLVITLARVNKGKELEKIANENFLKTTKEYEAIKMCRKILEDNTKLQISTIELLQITDYFLGSHSYNISYSYYQNWIKIENVVKNLIIAFGNKMHLDFSEDKVLLKELINHIKPAIYRVKNKIKLGNSIYDEFLASYPNIFKHTKESVEDIEKILGIKFSDDEIAFLAIYFKEGLERIKERQREKKNILLVCAHGYGTSKLLAQQLNDRYSLNIVKIIPRYMLEKTLDKGKIDLILSTVRIDKKINIPILKVNTVLTQNDIQNLDKFQLPRQNKKVFLSEIMEIIEKNCIVNDKENLIRNLKSYFDVKLVDDIEQNKLTLVSLLKEENIKLMKKVNNWEEGVKQAGKILLDGRYITEEYIFSMIESIRKFGSYVVISEGIALPHSNLNNSVIQSGMSLLKLDESVIFPGNKKVNIIITFCSVNMNEYHTALFELNELIIEKKFYDSILKARNKEEILEYLIKNSN